MATTKPEFERIVKLDSAIEDEGADFDAQIKKKVLLKLKHVDVKFNVRGRTLNAIRDANLEINEGETLAIVGESGSGKSVLTKTFAGMLDSNGFISHGNIYFYDDSLSQTRVYLDWANRILYDKCIRMLNLYSYEECAFKEYEQLVELEESEREASVMGEGKKAEFEAALKQCEDDYNDALNVYMSISRGHKNKARRDEAKAKVKLAEKAKKEELLRQKQAHKAAKAAYKADVEARTAYAQKKAELDEARAKLIAESKAKGLTKETIERNERIAKEIVLSVGRYAWASKFRYAQQLLHRYAEFMRLGKDLTTEKQNRRVFEPVLFRVEYRSSGMVETHKLKIYIDEVFSYYLKQDVVEDELLHNESLLDQARGLHPHMRKHCIRKLKKAITEAGLNEVENAAKLADLIILKASETDSLLKSWRICNVLLGYACDVYKSKKTRFESKVKSKMVEALDGYAFVDCAKVRYLKDWEQIRGRRIATVFQDPMTSLDPILTIGKQIMMVIQKHQHCSTFEAKRRALQMMDKVGIPDPEKRFDDYPFQYSGGMRQRIVIAIALSCQPKILICDEPTTALDVTIQAQILELIKKLSKDLGFTTVYITHDLGVVANVADRVAVLYGGQIVELGTVEDIFFDPRHPYTWALLSSMPQLATAGKDLFCINGTPPSLYTKIKGDAFAPRNEYAMAIDFVKEPPMFQISKTHFAKTWLLDPRAPKIEKPEIIQNLHEKMMAIYKIEEEKK